jgi:hypothetical protein
MSEEEKKSVDNQIESAKWEMYGEEWEAAKNNLQNAKRTAIRIKDKEIIDIILDLLRKIKQGEKVPM